MPYRQCPTSSSSPRSTTSSMHISHHLRFRIQSRLPLPRHLPSCRPPILSQTSTPTHTPSSVSDAGAGVTAPSHAPRPPTGEASFLALTRTFQRPGVNADTPHNPPRRHSSSCATGQHTNTCTSALQSRTLRSYRRILLNKPSFSHRHELSLNSLSLS